MMRVIKDILGISRRAYERQKKILAAGDALALQKLAADTETQPEILYFLAEKGDDTARLSTAKNISTPVQAAEFLARDKSVDVRLALAERLVKLLPDLSLDKHAQLYAYVVSALKTLAEDEVVTIRAALSSTLKDYAKAPPAVVTRLARDVERAVAEPILQACAALPDDVMLDILSQHPAAWVVEAIAGRKSLTTTLTAAVVASKNDTAVQILLDNEGALFATGILESLIEEARTKNEWQKPIALRRELTVGLVRQLIGFAETAVLNVLNMRRDFEPAQRETIGAIVKRRLIYVQQAGPDETPLQKIERFAKEGQLSADLISDALSWKDKDVALYALSLLARVDIGTVKKMIDAGTARPVVALCHRAQVPMRVCVEIQQQLAKLPPKDILYARGGTEYPLEPGDITWQLEFFGIKK
jgi:uncharacterized protein (DUF2336 family)